MKADDNSKCVINCPHLFGGHVTDYLARTSRVYCNKLFHQYFGRLAFNDDCRTKVRLPSAL